MIGVRIRGAMQNLGLTCLLQCRSLYCVCTTGILLIVSFCMVGGVGSSTERGGGVEDSEKPPLYLCLFGGCVLVPL